MKHMLFRRGRRGQPKQTLVDQSGPIDSEPTIELTASDEVGHGEQAPRKFDRRDVLWAGALGALAGFAGGTEIESRRQSGMRAEGARRRGGELRDADAAGYRAGVEAARVDAEFQASLAIESVRSRDQEAADAALELTLAFLRGDRKPGNLFAGQLARADGTIIHHPVVLGGIDEGGMNTLRFGMVETVGGRPIVRPLLSADQVGVYAAYDDTDTTPFLAVEFSVVDDPHAVKGPAFCLQAEREDGMRFVPCQVQQNKGG